MTRVRTQKPRIRRGRSWLEILPADPRDPDVVRAKALARAQQLARPRRMRELTDLNQADGLPDVFLAGHDRSTRKETCGEYL
jgi:hypothetical protein